MSLSFQLFSARSLPDQHQLLKDLAGLGYAHVEGFGGVYDNPELYRAAMDEAGLTMPSGHLALRSLETAFDEQMALCSVLGMHRLYVPHLVEAERPIDSAGYKALANRLCALSDKVTDHGLSLGWHNHEFEMIALDDGGIPMEILLNESPNISWEADLAWVAVAKADPTAYLEQWGDRMSAIHMKDLAPAGEKTDEDGWADVGEGVLDWKTLSQTVKRCAPEALVVIEHDNPSDVLRFASTSINNYKTF